VSRSKTIACAVVALAAVATIGHYLGWGTVFVLAVALVFVMPPLMERRRAACLERGAHGYRPK
jgi:hypothetical protein